MPALVTFVHVTAERRRAACGQGATDASVVGRIASDQRLNLGTAQDVGHLEGRPIGHYTVVVIRSSRSRGLGVWRNRSVETCM